MAPIVENGGGNDRASNSDECNCSDCINERCVRTEEDDCDDRKMKDLLDWLLVQSSEMLESFKTHTLVIHPGTMVMTSNNREEIETLCKDYENECFLVISKV
jgi:hypothetical protein